MKLMPLIRRSGVIPHLALSLQHMAQNCFSNLVLSLRRLRDMKWMGRIATLSCFLLELLTLWIVCRRRV